MVSIVSNEINSCLATQETIESCSQRKILAACDAIAASGKQFLAPAINPARLRVSRNGLQKLLDAAPAFTGYKIGQGTRFSGTLTDMTVRPANLFYNALFGADAVTLPGSGELFAFTKPHSEIKKLIASANPDDVVSFSATGVPSSVKGRFTPNLADVLGNRTYRISYRELQETLESQKIHVSPVLPVEFYKAFKVALREDGIVILPGHDSKPVKLRDLRTPHCKALVKKAQEYFSSKRECENVLDLTLYQIGSLVVKTEDFRIFMDSQGKLIQREPGEKDAIRLINACGIRGIHSTEETRIDNRTIMRSAFQTALKAAESGFVIFPAVGMGVWGGDPNLYWRSFLDAVVTSGSSIDRIFVNPGHQKTWHGTFEGCNGEEFQILLGEYIRRCAGDPQASSNLSKIVNLYNKKTDVVQLAHLLKKNYPDKIVSLFNASDPDVTLGYHVGEYVNNLGHASTTEENYTALGTNGLCFEGITGVHEDPDRVVQANL